MKDSQTLINAEQIEMDAMEVTIDHPSKAKKRLQSYTHVHTLPSNIHFLVNIKKIKPHFITDRIPKEWAR